jgi:predicted component of type VI protein secretion system
MKIVLDPLSGGPTVEITRPLTIVGRKDGMADMIVPHKSVSKQHCVLLHTEGLLFLRDLGSTNGTRVNGQRVRRAALLPNDRISFAGVPYRVRYGTMETPVDHGHTEMIPAEALDRIRTVAVAEPAEDSHEEPTGLPSIVRHALPDVIPDGPR